MDTKKKPIKRHTALQPLSRQHHFGLLFSWKIRKGFNKNIDPQRMMKFATWFYKNEIKPHFSDEEKYLFPIMEPGNELVERALKEHRRIKRLFLDTTDPERTLHRLEEELDAHIRFEERILFNEIQKVATEEQLRKVEEIHEETEQVKEYSDPFWDE
ncbi:hemerythrin domain-containing protein [Aequorivita sp. H23M31]|uniref:Hemerythrin domain-containing protein n=1 Tax=Aequorivita ciconiae TaxID=2494375 RepID=A0A410G1X5_9FLAO|nr:hemerythrin domain-containing protein [Aequorivita sp. H23M31]QAA81250.1 hemerythrin domain-containing protein [Aequorivita sp. H23M31]